MIKKIVRDTEGNIITERPISEIEIIRPPFRCIIKRNGQEDPNKGNRVIVKCSFFTTESPIIRRFNFDLWGIYCVVLNGRIGKVTNFANRDFLSDTWKDAFEQAERCFCEGCDQYERLIFEREQALKNAE